MTLHTRQVLLADTIMEQTDMIMIMIISAITITIIPITIMIIHMMGRNNARMIKVIIPNQM